ncbi:Uncharacterised protein [Mycobacteroides abscessus subsp. massiliense]|nr:Uncharacterised protein [Mycobacteroides abscessus subsp. massiliense]
MVVFPEFEVHLPLDEPVAAVLPDQHHQRDALSYGSLDLLGVHQEGAIAGHGQHLRIGAGQLDAQRSGQCETHGGQPIRDKTGIGLIGRIETRYPHLGGTGVDEHDVAAAQRCPDVGHDPLRRHGET